VRQKEQDQKSRANMQKFYKTTTYRLDVPINPNDKQKVAHNEEQKLMKNQRKYV
jgi:hypothetical protein